MTWQKILARIIIILWAGFWVFFAVATILGEPYSGVGLLACVFFSLLFIISALVPFRWERAGAYLLITLGVVFLIAYPLRMAKRMPLLTVLFVILTLATPPIISGILLLTYKRRKM